MNLPDRALPASNGPAPSAPPDWVEPSRAAMPALVREALARDRAQLAFQPIVTAGSPAQVSFYEGFIRLLDEAGRVLPAGLFMDSVEETTLGREIDCASLRLGLGMLRKNPRLRLAINVSARSIGDGEWRRILESGLGREGGPGGALGGGVGERLILEISEGSAMLLPDVVIRFMAEMRPRGVSFAMDDFGAGLMAFRHLRDFRFECVKVDRCFVAGIDASPDNQVLARALITVAHQFEMFAVAEGVETEAEAQHLRSLGFDCLQGYLFGRPKPTL